MRYNSYNDDILYMIERVSRTGSGDYLSPSIFSVRYNTYDEETNPTIVGNMVKSILCGVTIGIFDKPILMLDRNGYIKFALGFLNVPNDIYVKHTDQVVKKHFKLITVDSWKINKMGVDEYSDIEMFRKVLVDTYVYSKDKNSNNSFSIFYKEIHTYISGMFLIYPWFDKIYNKILGHVKMLKETFSSKDIVLLEQYIKLPNRLADLIDEKKLMENAGFSGNNNLGTFVCKDLSDIFGEYVYEGLYRYTYRIGDTKIIRESKTGSSDPLIIGIPNDNLPVTYSESSIGKLINDINNNCYMYRYLSEDSSLLTKLKLINKDIHWIEYFWEADKKTVVTKKAEPRVEKEGFLNKVLGLFKKKEVIEEEIPKVEVPKPNKPILKYYGSCYYSLTLDSVLHDIERVDKLFISFTTFDKSDKDRLYNGINLKHNTAKSNRMPYSTKGYYPSYDFGLIKQGRLTSNIKEIYTKKQKEEIDNGLLKVMESIDLEVLRNTLKNISYLTGVGFWEIKVKENDVVLISDKYHKDKLIHVFGDKYVRDYETRGEKVKLTIKDEDVEVFENYRYRIPKVFEVDTTEDDYVQEVYVD